AGLCGLGLELGDDLDGLALREGRVETADRGPARDRVVRLARLPNTLLAVDDARDDDAGRDEEVEQLARLGLRRIERRSDLVRAGREVVEGEQVGDAKLGTAVGG